MAPQTRYTRAGGVHIAYQVAGDGPVDVVFVDQWFSHVEAAWDVPPIAALRERIARFSRLIMFDKRGSGLSDPVPTAVLPSFGAWTADVEAVLDAVGSKRAVVIANIGAGMIGMSFAAEHPDRTASLVLVDCFARFLEAPDFPIGFSHAVLEQALEEAEARTGQGVMLDFFAPSLAGDERLRSVWSRYERQQASPGTTRAVVRLIYEADARDLLPRITVPTLVIHRTDARVFPVAHGRYIAEHIPNSRLVELPGGDQLIWAGNQDEIMAEIQEFATGFRRPPESRRALATVLFTDIVGSTARVVEVGDSRWRSIVDEHDRVVRSELAGGGGRVIKATGDGYLATFDSPARAIRTTQTIVAELHTAGIEVRAGLHTGEIELIGDDVAGVAVHIASRISGLASSGEVYVSSTVRDLVAGSGIAFDDRGTHNLKGVPDEWRIFAVKQD